MQDKHLQSEVPDFKGPCVPVWLNTNQVDLRTQSVGITGFFKLVRKHWLFGHVKTGKEFHGYITNDGRVKTTIGIMR